MARTAQEFMNLIEENGIQMIDFKIVDINGQYQHLLNSFTFITKQIQNIPKEITVKNVLNIP